MDAHPRTDRARTLGRAGHRGRAQKSRTHTASRSTRRRTRRPRLVRLDSGSRAVEGADERKLNTESSWRGLTRHCARAGMSHDRDTSRVSAPVHNHRRSNQHRANPPEKETSAYAVDLAHASVCGAARCDPRCGRDGQPNCPLASIGALCKMADRGQISGAVRDGPLQRSTTPSKRAARSKASDPRCGTADIPCADSRAGTCSRSSSNTWAGSAGRDCRGRARAHRAHEPREYTRGAYRIVRHRAHCGSPSG